MAALAGMSVSKIPQPDSYRHPLDAADLEGQLFPAPLAEIPLPAPSSDLTAVYHHGALF
jgi:hypothetical protein